MLKFLPKVDGLCLQQVEDYHVQVPNEEYNLIGNKIVPMSGYVRLPFSGQIFPIIFRNHNDKKTLIINQNDNMVDFFLLSDGNCPVQDEKIKKYHKYASSEGTIEYDEHGFRPFFGPEHNLPVNDRELAKETSKAIGELTPHYKEFFKQGLVESKESETLKKYTGNHYSAMNLFLVEHKDFFLNPTNDSIGKECLELLRLIQKTKCPNQVRLFRGTTDFRYHLDRVYRNPCFMSTSVDEHVALRFSRGAVIQYLVPKGYPALYVNAQADYPHGGEQEVILPPGTRFKIIDKYAIEKTAYGPRVFYKAKILF